MNKRIVTALVGVITFVPVFAFAQTDNSKAAQIAALQQLIVILTKELEQLLAARHTTPTQSASPASQSSIDYSSYTPVSMTLYAADTSAYLGKGVITTGMVNTFMPKGGSGGTTNYIQIINPFDQSQPKMQLEIDDGATYTATVAALQDKSSPIYQFIRVYGTGVRSQAFTQTSLFGSGTVMVPVANVTRVDKCIHGSMNTTILTESSFDDNFTCTSWQTIAPSSPTTPAIPVSSSSQTFTTPRSGAVIDQNRNVISTSAISPVSNATPTPNQVIPTDRASVLTLLKQNASVKWGSNYTMVKYEYDQQVVAYDWVVSQTKYPDIMTKAKQKWGDDYTMVKYEYGQQSSAYEWIMAQTTYPDIMQAAKAKWADDYMMVKYEYNQQVAAYKSL